MRRGRESEREAPTGPGSLKPRPVSRLRPRPAGGPALEPPRGRGIGPRFTPAHGRDTRYRTDLAEKQSLSGPQTAGRPHRIRRQSRPSADVKVRKACGRGPRWNTAQRNNVGTRDMWRAPLLHDDGRQWLPMRHDWEKVLTPVLDHVLGQPDVDGVKLVVVGVSLGG
ncbi:hypothetical protein CDD83_6552 [Cordyceps sp. RAO-2017]|nr:hypothetical protein CDD83_6552 [Cordyceps sp. RAO-2017]